MAAETAQEELVEARVKDGTEKHPAPGTDRLGGGDDRARRVKTRACRETRLGADSEHVGPATPSRRLGITPQ